MQIDDLKQLIKNGKSLNDQLIKNMLLHFTPFLDGHYTKISLRQRAWHIKNNTMHIVKCQYCDNPGQFVYSHNHYKPCGAECDSKKFANIRLSTTNQRESTMIKKYGVKLTSHSNIINQKIHDTQMSRYGNAFSRTSEFKNKMIKTSRERYGVDNPSLLLEVKNKMTSTNLKKYGYKSSAQSPKVKAKFVATSIKRYGVPNPMQHEINKLLWEKSSVTYKEYQMPSGKIVKVQGNEPAALNELLKIYVEQDLFVGRKIIEQEIGTFKYDNRTYYPDIYIKSKNLIIEVKSEFTYKRRLEENMQKAQCVINMGHHFQFMIFNGKKTSFRILSMS